MPTQFFFHWLKSSRRRINSIITINVNGTQIEGVTNVKAIVYYNFVNHFKSDTINKPDLEDFSFNTFGIMKRGELILVRRLNKPCGIVITSKVLVRVELTLVSLRIFGGN